MTKSRARSKLPPAAKAAGPKTSTRSEASDSDISQLADLFRLMGDSTRLRIILICLSTPICVSEIASRLELSQSLVSHHLRLLRAARILRSERRGKQIFYTAADQHILCVIEDMVAHVGEIDPYTETA